MRIYEEPEVYLICKPQFNEEEARRFVRRFGTDEEWQPQTDSDAVKLVETAGRVCYMSFWGRKRPTAAYITNILDMKHGSVLEHANWSVLIEGISRSCSHELVRHRHFSYSQLSQRFVGPKHAGIVIPPALRNADEELKKRFIELAKEAYDNSNDELLKEKVTKFVVSQRPEIATNKAVNQILRGLLPNCVSTNIVVTGNARAWRHFFELRGSRYADAEIRQLANKIYDVLVKEASLLFGDFDKEKLSDGTYELSAKYTRV